MTSYVPERLDLMGISLLRQRAILLLSLDQTSTSTRQAREEENSQRRTSCSKDYLGRGRLGGLAVECIRAKLMTVQVQIEGK